MLNCARYGSLLTSWDFHTAEWCNCLCWSDSVAMRCAKLLVWSSNWTQRVWRLSPGRTKNGREHHVPLSDAAIALVRDLPNIQSEEGWVFTLNGDVPVSNLARCKRRLDQTMLYELRKGDPHAELEPWRLHDLRHTLKTWMQQARIPKDVRNAVQNHFDGDMDELYGHYSFEKEKREAMDAWAGHVENLITSKSGEIVALPTRRVS
jgi:integrase